MRIAEFFSHLNGHEFIAIHKPQLWGDLEQAISAVRPEREPEQIGSQLAASLVALGWSEDLKHSKFRRVSKDRIAVSVGVGNGDDVPVARHAHDYSRDIIDVGIVVRLTQEFRDDLGITCPTFEDERRTLIEEGRGCPRAPLVFIAVSA